MTFRDLSYWGLFKIILIVNWAVPILFSPLILFVWLTNPSAIKYSPSSEVLVYGISLRYGGEGLDAFLNLLPIILIIGLIGLLIQTALLKALAHVTPLGRVKIGGEREGL